MIKISYSGLSTYLACPRRYYYEYIFTKGEEVKSDAMAIGIGIHSFIEQLSLNPKLTLEECKEIYLKNAKEAKCLKDITAPEKSLNLVVFYYANKAKYLLKPKLTEHYFNIDMDFYRLSGKIDVITKNGAVVDYKTARERYSTYELRFPLDGKGFQLSVYALAYYLMFNTLPSKVGFQIIVKDCSEIQNIAIKRTAEDIPKVRLFIDNTVKRIQADIETNLFKRLPVNCRFCANKGICK